MHDLAKVQERMTEMAAREAAAGGWSDMRRSLEHQRAAFGPHLMTDFMLTYGRDYRVGPNSYAGRRGTPKLCYMNAAHLALDNTAMTYVEGKITVHGVPIDHAWCVDSDGIVVDPTIVPDADGTASRRVNDYFGVPFETAYLRKAMLWNKVYGLLDYFAAHKTVPKLVELGLDAGQRWLIDQPLKPPRKKRTKKKAA